MTDMRKRSSGFADPHPDPAHFVTPGFQQFRMERTTETRELRLRAETTYLSVPMLEKMWSDAPAGYPATDDLAGAWDGESGR